MTYLECVSQLYKYWLCIAGKFFLEGTETLLCDHYESALSNVLTVFTLVGFNKWVDSKHLRKRGISLTAFYIMLFQLRMPYNGTKTLMTAKQLWIWEEITWKAWGLTQEPQQDNRQTGYDSSQERYRYERRYCCMAATDILNGLKHFESYTFNRPWRHIGLWGVEFPTFSIDSRLTDGGNVVSLTCRQPLSPQEDSWYSFLLEAESTPGPYWGWKD
jgi:hypothetical protein